MAVSQRQSVAARLLTPHLPRETALAAVARLYQLLPGKGSSSINFKEGPLPLGTVQPFDVPSYRRFALKNSFLKKFKGFTFGDPKVAARRKFLQYEDRCREFNHKFRHHEKGFDPFLQSVLLTAQRKISRVLGKFDIDSVMRLSRWGPGSTSSCNGAVTASAKKFSSRPDVTPEFLSRARLLMPLFPSWSALLADADFGVLVNPIMPLVRGNKITFVPKTAEIDRVIAVEPHINVFFQNGIGRLIRERMKNRANIDLNDQTLNQRLAHLGSVDNSLATIDLEGASDTICRELVRQLLPEDWFSWLDVTRSHVGMLDGEEIRYHKFSSMGNGATFDLESLIFWAVVSAVTDLTGYNSFWVNVFGDDIVCPSGCYDKVAEVLDSLGFIVNLKKSYSSGPFRESCGKDFYEGQNVRPVYLKDIPVRPVDWILICNQLRLLAHTWAGNQGCDASLETAYRYALSQVPKQFHHFKVPLGFQLRKNHLGGFEGNGLLSNLDEACPKREAEFGWDGWIVRGFGPKAMTTESTDRHILTSAISNVPSQWGGNTMALRDRYRYREVSLFIPFSWYSLGPWIHA